MSAEEIFSKLLETELKEPNPINIGGLELPRGFKYLVFSKKSQPTEMERTFCQDKPLRYGLNGRKQRSNNFWLFIVHLRQ